MTNEDIARRLRHHASELSRAGDNLYRVRAFRQAAMAVLTLPEPVDRLDPSALERVPGIGRSLAGTIGEYAKTGQWLPNPRAGAASPPGRNTPNHGLAVRRRPVE